MSVRRLMCLRLRLPRRSRPSRLIGAAGLAPEIVASTLVIKSLTQAVQFVDQRRALRAHPVAITLAAPSLRGAIEPRIIVDVTHR
jgi:hypothetical protein